MTTAERVTSLLRPKSGRLLLSDARAALEGTDVTGYFFTAQTAISGPWSLIGLLVNGAMVIDAPISTSDRVITVDISDHINDEPFSIRWAILFGQNQPKCVPYVVKDRAVTRYAEKRGAEGGSIWLAKTHLFPKENS